MPSPPSQNAHKLLQEVLHGSINKEPLLNCDDDDSDDDDGHDDYDADNENVRECGSTALYFKDSWIKAQINRRYDIVNIKCTIIITYT